MRRTKPEGKIGHIEPTEKQKALIKYEPKGNNFELYAGARFPNNDALNLMKLLKKQSEDNKPILYLGKNEKKVIITLEKYEQVEKSLKALEIIKSKKWIPLDRINPKFWNDKQTYNEVVDYDFYLWLCEEECEFVVKDEQRLTEEEFELLRSVLE